MAEIEAMPRDILKLWFWRDLAAKTAEHQGLVRRAAQILYPPPAVAPVYRFTEPAEVQAPEPEKVAPTPVKKAKAEPAAKAAPELKHEEPEQSPLDLFKSLFR